MTAEELFWRLASELQAEDPRIVEGTIMNGRCLRVGKEFLALVDYKGSGLVVKLPKARVAELVERGVGQPFAPAGIGKKWAWGLGVVEAFASGHPEHFPPLLGMSVVFGTGFGWARGRASRDATIA